MLGIVYGCLSIYCFFGLGVNAGRAETELRKRLLDGYDSLSRPVKHELDPVFVQLGLMIQQIIDVDEKNQVIETNHWLEFAWKDPVMVWDPDDYEGITEIRMSSTEIWTPDILLYNSVDDDFNSLYQSNVLVFNTSDIYWLPPAIVKSTCKINIQWFPFDEQFCKLKYGSWTYSEQHLRLTEGKVSTTTYVQNGEWKLISVTAQFNKVNYDCCFHPYHDITFWIHAKRRTLYYGFNLIIPCLLIAMMAMLDFLLPPEAGEKLTLGITVFMSLCVFLLMVAEALPPTSDAVPLIGVYFSTVMIIVSASQVFTVMVLNFHYRDPDMHTMPIIMQKIFLHWLPCILLIKKPPYMEDKIQSPEEREEALECSDIAHLMDYSVEPKVILPPSRSPIPFSRSLLANVLDTDDNALCRIRSFNEGLNNSSCLPSSGVLDMSVHSSPLHQTKTQALNEITSNIIELRSLLDGIYREVGVITNKIKADDREEMLKRDWKFAANVLDRLCLFSFSAIFCLATCAIMFSAPHGVVP